MKRVSLLCLVLISLGACSSKNYFFHNYQRNPSRTSYFCKGEFFLPERGVVSSILYISKKSHQKRDHKEVVATMVFPDLSKESYFSSGLKKGDNKFLVYKDKKNLLGGSYIRRDREYQEVVGDFEMTKELSFFYIDFLANQNAETWKGVLTQRVVALGEKGDDLPMKSFNYLCHRQR